MCVTRHPGLDLQDSAGGDGLRAGHVHFQLPEMFDAGVLRDEGYADAGQNQHRMHCVESDFENCVIILNYPNKS